MRSTLGAGLRQHIVIPGKVKRRKCKNLGTTRQRPRRVHSRLPMGMECGSGECAWRRTIHRGRGFMRRGNGLEKPSITMGGEKLVNFGWPRGGTVMPGRTRAGFCLLILLAAWCVAGKAAACQMEQAKLSLAHRPLTEYARHSPPAASSLHPMADDGLTYFSVDLQVVAASPFSPHLLTFTRFAILGAEKDLLSLTQRRRE